jgi:hypothetical protein
MILEEVMKEYNLRKIFEQIVNISKDIAPFTVERLWEWTKFDGINKHLNNSLIIHKYSGVPIGGRKELLNNQNIKGKYLLFEFIGHLPEFDIKQYNKFEEIIETIISSQGILNPFTTLEIPIINGEAKDILFALKYQEKYEEEYFKNELEKETIEKIKTEIVEKCKEK